MQIEYDGVKEYKSHSGIDTKFIFPKAAAKIVATDERMLFVDGLVPRTEYTFNISAYFTDDTWGPVHQIRVQTSIGGLLYRSLCVCFKFGGSSWPITNRTNRSVLNCTFQHYLLAEKTLGGFSTKGRTFFLA